MMQTKRCSKCRETKPIHDFYRVRKGQEERQARCKLCYERGRKDRPPRMTRGLNGRFCPLCAGLSWRVRGPRCRHCGLEFREEQAC